MARTPIPHHRRFSITGKHIPFNEDSDEEHLVQRGNSDQGLPCHASTPSSSTSSSGSDSGSLKEREATRRVGTTSVLDSRLDGALGADSESREGSAPSGASAFSNIRRYFKDTLTLGGPRDIDTNQNRDHQLQNEYHALSLEVQELRKRLLRSERLQEHNTARFNEVLAQRDAQIVCMASDLAVHRDHIDKLVDILHERDRTIRGQALECETRVTAAWDEVERAQERTRLLKIAGDELSESLRMCQQKLDSTTEELSFAQALGGAQGDKCSVADISRMIAQLNEHIFQFSAFLGDVVEKELTKAKGGDEVEGDAGRRRKRAVRGLQEKWGDHLVDRLLRQMGKDEPDTSLFECMVQNVLVQWCWKLICTFTYHVPNSVEGKANLDRLFKSISETRGLQCAKSWLSITYSQMKHAKVEFSPAIDEIWHLLNAIGVSENTSQKKIDEKIANLGQMVLTTKAASFEDLLSADVRPYFHPLGTRFDSSCMDDVYECEERSGRRGAVNYGAPPRIALTTSLGVDVQSCKPGNSGRTILLKSKVLLASSLS